MPRSVFLYKVRYKVDIIYNLYPDKDETQIFIIYHYIIIINIALDNQKEIFFLIIQSEFLGIEVSANVI